MSDEQETKLPEAVEVAEGEAKEETSKEASPPAADEGGDEPKKKEEEAVEAAESTATFEPVVSSTPCPHPIPVGLVLEEGGFISLSG